jgi:WhiB family redox-sensing transcriptional regulator
MTITIHTESRPVADFTPDRTDWRTRAACVGMDVEWFFPRDSEDAKIERAKAVCSRCTVVAECLEAALTPGRITEGIWGGLTDAERDMIRRKRRRT